MHDDRISALETEIAKLRAEVADVREALRITGDSSLDDSKKMWDWITHLAYKVLPQHAGTRQQVDEIFRAGDMPPKSNRQT